MDLSSETIGGIEVVKASAQEPAERRKFEAAARAYRDAFVDQGQIQARYLPTLLLAIALAAAFLHGVELVTRGRISVGDLVAYMGLMGILRFPTFISIFTFSLVQLGLSGASRILELIETETELDENRGGHAAAIAGEIAFEDVRFGYGAAPVLDGVSFRAAPGETVAIVGQAGSGKTTLTQLVSRIYDVQSGRVRIDGVDVRDWQLQSLRSQISVIEQDPFLFSRSIAERNEVCAPARLLPWSRSMRASPPLASTQASSARSPAGSAAGAAVPVRFSVSLPSPSSKRSSPLTASDTAAAVNSRQSRLQPQRWT